MGDDLARPRAMRIVLPFETTICPLCRTKGKYKALSLNDYLLHVKEKHADQATTFQCRTCDKEYKSKHAAQCHIPKCPGKKHPIVGGFSCEECRDTFASKPGLSQHKRHRHPLVRHMERIPDPPRLRAPRGGVGFSAEEVQTLLQLEITYKGDVDIVTKMTELLKSKTRQQIRDKRLVPAYIRQRAEMAVAAQQQDSGATTAQVQTPVLRRLRGSRIPIRTPSQVLVDRLSRLADSSRRSAETVAGDLAVAEGEPPKDKSPSPQTRATEAEDERMSDNSATVVPAIVHTVVERETEEPSQLQLRAETISSHDSGEDRQNLLPDPEMVWRQGIIASFVEGATTKVPQDVLDVLGTS
jgi:hypothetical protein